MSPSLGFVLNRSSAVRRCRSGLSSCESGRPRLSASRSIGEQTHIASDEPGPRPGKALHYRPSSTATQARPRQHETMNRYHPAPPVEKGNIERMPHRQRVHIATAREHHDRRIRPTPRQSAQPQKRARGYHPSALERGAIAISYRAKTRKRRFCVSPHPIGAFT